MASNEHINPEGLSRPTGYTHVVAAGPGRTVYVAGQVAVGPDGDAVSAELEPQVRQAYANLKTALDAAGASVGDLVKTTVFVVGYRPEHRATIARVRAEIFEGIEPPANTLLGVTALAAPEFLVEVEGIAVIPDDSEV